MMLLPACSRRRGRLPAEALIAALESGRLAGAAVDVLAGEGQGRALASPLVAYAATHDNLLITPHIGGATRDSMEKTEIFIAEKLVRALEAAATPHAAERGRMPV